MRGTNLIFILLIGTIAGCTGNKENPVKGYFNDFEQMYYWNQGANVTRYDLAASGKWVSWAYRSAPYSVGLSSKVSLLEPTKFQKVEISCKVYSEMVDSIEPIMVLSIDSANSNILWEGQSIAKQLKPSQWSSVFSVMHIKDPDRLCRGDNFLKIYLYNPQNGKVLIDDLHVVFQP